MAQKKGIIRVQTILNPRSNILACFYVIDYKSALSGGTHDYVEFICNRVENFLPHLDSQEVGRHQAYHGEDGCDL